MGLPFCTRVGVSPESCRWVRTLTLRAPGQTACRPHQLGRWAASYQLPATRVVTQPAPIVAARARVACTVAPDGEAPGPNHDSTFEQEIHGRGGTSDSVDHSCSEDTMTLWEAIAFDNHRRSISATWTFDVPITSPHLLRIGTTR